MNGLESYLTISLYAVRCNKLIPILNISDLGDWLSLEFMDEMLRLHGCEESNFVLRLLPPFVHHALPAFPSTNLRSQAREAKHLYVAATGEPRGVLPRGCHTES